MGETKAPSPAAAPDASIEARQRLKENGGKRRIGGRLAWLVSWATKGGLAITDQALFAGAQFVLNILLARWLLPAEYGAFAVAYSVFLFTAAAHNALLVEPMMVFGSGRHLKDLRRYLGIVLRGHWFLTIPAGLLLFGAALLVGRVYSHSVELALCALGLVLPLLLLAWLVRRAFYIELRPGRSATGSAVYFCSLLALVWWLHHAGKITPATAILAMGAAALLAAGLQLFWLRPAWSRIRNGITLRLVASEHWGYGRWVLASAVPSWALLNIYYLALPAWFGLKSAGALKALANLAMPAGHSFTTLGALILPLMVRYRNKGGLPAMRRVVRRIGGLFLTGAVLYFVVLWVFRVQIIHLLYGGKYLEYSTLPVLLVGLVPVATACSVPFGVALRACNRPDRIFWGYLAGSVLAASIGLWLAASRGLVGALSGYLLSYAVLICVFWFSYRKLGSETASA